MVGVEYPINLDSMDYDLKQIVTKCEKLKDLVEGDTENDR